MQNIQRALRPGEHADDCKRSLDLNRHNLCRDRRPCLTSPERCAREARPQLIDDGGDEALHDVPAIPVRVRVRQ